MASYIITHGYAHRMTASGVMESTKVLQDGDQISVDETGWTHRVPESMDLTGGDFETIKNALHLISQHFPDGKVRVYKQPVKPTKPSAVQQVL